MTEIQLPSSGLDPRFDKQTVELTPRQIASYMERLSHSLGVPQESRQALANAVEATASTDLAWARLEGGLRNLGVSTTFARVKEMIELLAAEEQRLGQITRGEHMEAPLAVGLDSPSGHAQLGAGAADITGRVPLSQAQEFEIRQWLETAGGASQFTLEERVAFERNVASGMSTSEAFAELSAGQQEAQRRGEARRKATTVHSEEALQAAYTAALLRARGDLPEDFNVAGLAFSDGYEEALTAAQAQIPGWSDTHRRMFEGETTGPTAEDPMQAGGQADTGLIVGGTDLFADLPTVEEEEPEDPLLGGFPQGFGIRKPPRFPLPSDVLAHSRQVQMQAPPGIRVPYSSQAFTQGAEGAVPTTVEGGGGSFFRATYTASDAQNFWAGLGTEQVAAYQRLFIRAGLMTEEEQDTEFGIPGYATDAALTSLMGWANAHPDLIVPRTGTTGTNIGPDGRRGRADLFDALDILIEANRAKRDEEKQAEPIPVWVPSVYIAPDPDTLAQTVKSTFRSQLGRDPSPAELRQMVAAFGPEFRKEFDAQEAALRADWERRNVEAARLSEAGVRTDEEQAALESDERAFGVPLENTAAEFGAAPGSEFAEVPGTPAFTANDPNASWQEMFERRYAKEIGLIDRLAEARGARRSLLSSLGVVDRLVGD